jgi:type IV pilus assembly protein PilX
MNKQTGAALIVGLIFLVVLSMIGVTAARMSTLEERMSGNMRDRSIAMQAAEIALRDAEIDLANILLTATAPPAAPARLCPAADPACFVEGGKPVPYQFATNCNSSADVRDNGLCGQGAAPNLLPNILNNTSIQWLSGFTLNMTAANQTVAYGTYTGAAAIPGLSAQPRYAIEALFGGVNMLDYYRIWVRAQGVNPNTVVWLQSIFRP